ncbi:hypothetical protein OSB04_028681 [Centaurea solstitialis]|uniref:HAT C-terminal dimerisation domain-containing protein n=1 Tax=Centaurea solstitialis TaxID=347529 RepID=A0AA38SG87_9ASTR|nr:hypothetical protein OSB04_028681 [Centaurea solstitialis]
MAKPIQSKKSFFTIHIMSLLNTLVNEKSKRSRTNHPTSELGNYMATNFLANADFDDYLLAWWKAKEGQYLILAAMARDLLTIQAFTVASESAFPASGRDYLDGVARRQNETTLEDAIDINLETSLHNEEIELGLSSPNEDDASEELAEYEWRILCIDIRG